MPRSLSQRKPRSIPRSTYENRSSPTDFDFEHNIDCPSLSTNALHALLALQEDLKVDAEPVQWIINYLGPKYRRDFLDGYNDDGSCWFPTKISATMRGSAFVSLYPGGLTPLVFRLPPPPPHLKVLKRADQVAFLAIEALNVDEKALHFKLCEKDSLCRSQLDKWRKMIRQASIGESWKVVVKHAENDLSDDTLAKTVNPFCWKKVKAFWATNKE